MSNDALCWQVTVRVPTSHGHKNGVIVQANFSGDAQYQQHLTGPIHKKALAKAEAQRLRDLQLGANRGAAESALV